MEKKRVGNMFGIGEYFIKNKEDDIRATEAAYKSAFEKRDLVMVKHYGRLLRQLKEKPY